MAKSTSKWWEVWLGTVVRAGTKNIVTFLFNRLETKAPELFRALAWIHLKPEAKNKKLVFQGLITGLGTWGDVEIGKLGVPDMLKEAWESFFQDFPGSVTDYFARRERDIKFPDDYEGPTEADYPAIAAELRKLVSQDIALNFGELFQSVPLGFWVNKTEKFLRSLMTHPNPVEVTAFLDFFNGLEEEDKTKFFGMIEYFNDPVEFISFVRMTSTDRARIFDLARRAKDMTLVPKLTRWFAENRPQFEAFANRILDATTVGMKTHVTDPLDRHTIVRKLELDQQKNAYAAPPRTWFPSWVMWITGVVVGLAVVFLLLWGGNELALQWRRTSDAKINAARAERDSTLALQRELRDAAEQYNRLADSLVRHPSDAAPDSASPWR